MGYDASELAAIGERFNTESLHEWSGQIAQAARRDLARLKPRGITEKTLADIDASRREIQKLNVAQEREKKDVSTLTFSRREALEAAFDWREEVKGTAEAVFDSEPETLARFRTGVRVSQSLPKLISEVGILLGAAREHLPALKGVGGGEKLLKSGEEALARLKEAQRRQSDEHAQTPAATAELRLAQGTLYTRARFVTRMAQVEFRKEPALLGRYSYASLRRQESAAEGRRAKATRPASQSVRS